MSHLETSLWKASLSNFGDWTEYATSWYDQATHNDPVHISRLRIPQSFVDGLPRTLRPALRERVAYHQYHLLLSVTSLRGELPMPPRCTDSSVPTASISAWFGSLHRRKPNQTRQQKTCGNRYTSVLRQVAPTQTHPKTGAHPSGYAPGKKAADPNPYLPESVQGRPLPHPAPWYNVHGRSYNFCILALCAFPGVFHPDLVPHPPCTHTLPLSYYGKTGPLRRTCSELPPYITSKSAPSPMQTANPNLKMNYTPRTAPQPSESESVWPNP